MISKVKRREGKVEDVVKKSNQTKNKMKKQSPKTIKIRLHGECEIHFEDVFTLKKEYTKDNIKLWNEFNDEYTYESLQWDFLRTLSYTLKYEIREGKRHPNLSVTN